MKTDELIEQGLTAEQIKFVMAENGKDVNAARSSVSSLEAERDEARARAEKAEASLSAFAGKTPEEYARTISELTEENGRLKESHAAEIAGIKLENATRGKINDLKDVQPDMKDFVFGQLSGKIKMLEDGTIEGFDDAIKSLRETNPSAFVKEEVEKPKFTKGFNQNRGADGSVNLNSYEAKLAAKLAQR